MKVSELIEHLSTLDQDSEIALWNGYVGDWVPISETMEQIVLVKHNADYYNMHALANHVKQGVDVTKLSDEEIKALKGRSDESAAKAEYDLPNPYYSAEDRDMWYDKDVKRMTVLLAAPRGKTSTDRHGTIEY